MKKKGFTLIELLAVIIILAIIALIATPIVLNVIEDTRKSAFERSVDGYYKAAEFVYNEMFLNGDIQDIHLTFKDGVQTSNNDSYKIEVSGEKIKNGTIYIFEDGQITVDVQGDKYCATKINGSFEFNDCTGVATEIPEECFYIQNEPLANIDYHGDLDYTEDWQNENYNLLYYNEGQEGCPSKVNTLILPEEVGGEQVEGIFNYGAPFPVEAQTVIFPSNMKIIGGASFAGWDSPHTIKSVVLPDNLIFMGGEAFSGQLLTNVEIPNRVKRIGYYAFYDNQLANITIPNSVTYIMVGAFNNNQLPDSQAFIYARNTDGTEDKTAIISYGGAKKENVIIPEGVTIIDNVAFANNQLTSVTLPNTVTNIVANAFFDNKLTSVSIPSSVTAIGDNAFASNNFPDSNAITIEGDSTRFDSTWTSIGFPEKPNVANELLKQYNESNTVGLLKDTDNTYYYKGTNTEVANNFVWFGGHLWRVVSIDNDNNLTMITQQPVTAISPASSSVWTNQAQYEASYINHWLNSEADGVFYKSLTQEDKSKILNSTFNVGGTYIYSTNTVASINSITATQKVGLLDETQYTKAGGTDSFLDIKDYWWLGNLHGTVNALYIRNVREDGNLVYNSYSYAHGVRPVIKISNLTFTAGVGSLTDPFRETSMTTNTTNIKVGEYVSIPTTGNDCGADKRCLFRVVSKDNNSIKITLNGLLASTSSFDTNCSTPYVSGNAIDMTVKTFAETINNTYRYSGTDKTFGIGPYGSNYTEVQNTTYTGNFGLPVVGEMFTGNDLDMTYPADSVKTFVNANIIENSTVSYYFWTMNAESYSMERYVGHDGNLNRQQSFHAGGVRPVLFLNQGLTFTGGEGTAENPFILN